MGVRASLCNSIIDFDPKYTLEPNFIVYKVNEVTVLSFILRGLASMALADFRYSV